MARVLITGGTGVLGRELEPRLRQAGYTVRILSRRERPPGLDSAIEWRRAEIASGHGLAEAVAGVEVIVHAASTPFRAGAVDAGGAARLIALARACRHFAYISIVGIERIPFPYYRHKLAAESIVERGGLPWSILRATQFHTLIDMFLRPVAWMPVALLAADLRFQPIDAGEVAGRLAECVAAGPSGRLADIGGPAVLTLGELARAWMASRGIRRRIIRLPLPGQVAAAFRQGFNTVPGNPFGKITWGDWLAGWSAR